MGNCNFKSEGESNTSKISLLPLNNDNSITFL